MPRPGTAPEPEFEGLDYGENAPVNDLADMAELALSDEDDEFTPAGPEEEFLFGPTDRPAEPITAGAPFGPGPDATRYGDITDAQWLDRLAQRIAADPGADKAAKAFATRRLRGE